MYTDTALQQANIWFFGTATKEPACAALNQVAFPVFMDDALRVDAPQCRRHAARPLCATGDAMAPSTLIKKDALNPLRAKVFCVTKLRAFCDLCIPIQIQGAFSVPAPAFCIPPPAF